MLLETSAYRHVSFRESRHHGSREVCARRTPHGLRREVVSTFTMDYSSALAAAIECAEDVPEAIEAPESIVADDGDDQAEDDGIRNLPALNHVTNQVLIRAVS